jgi:hypothetical protein
VKRWPFEEFEENRSDGVIEKEGSGLGKGDGIMNKFKESAAMNGQTQRDRKRKNKRARLRGERGERPR